MKYLANMGLTALGKNGLLVVCFHKIVSFIVMNE